MKINEIRSLAHGESVSEVIGILSQVGDRKVLTNSVDGSTFTAQNARLDVEGVKIYVEFSNFNDVSIVDGHEVELRSVTSEHGTVGVTVKDVIKGDRTLKNLRVTPSAKFLIGDRVHEAPAPSKRKALREKLKNEAVK